MRARNLKPSLFKNELLAVADPLYTVIFEGLWCLADREGRLEDRPARIHFDINPGRALETTENALAWLHDNGFILRYQVGQGRYIQVIKFKEHQNPHHKEPPSKIPAPGQAQDLPRVSLGHATDQPHSDRADSGFPFPDSPSPLPDSASSLLDESKACGEMSAALRERGVNVTSFHPTLVAWVRDGFRVDQVLEAVEIARKSKPNGNIPANYLDPILREPQRGPPKRLSKFERVMAELGDVGDQGFG